MADIDAMPAALRKTVHCFGYAIVRDMLEDGWQGKLGDLIDILETWRERRQQQWLQTDFITKRFRDIFHEALRRSRFVGRITES